jgi:class 3 adenylate cyclase
MAEGTPVADRSARLRSPWAAILALPLVGLALLLAQPQLDVHWEHHPSHFWLVLVTAAISSALAYVTNVAAGRHRDARLVLVSLAFLACAGFLGLHALATPGVLLAGSNTGFMIATPIGLVIGAVFAAASTSPLAGPHAGVVLRRRSLLLGGLLAVMAAWGVISVAGMPPLDRPPPAREAAGPLAALAAVGTGLYGLAAWRYLGFYRRRGGVVTLTVAVASVLLAEALIAVAVSRNWQLSWWEWHVLMLLAFAAIALGAREEYRRSGSLTAAFGGIYLEATLARIDRWHARAIAAVAAAGERGDSTEPVLANLRREGASTDEVALLAKAAGEVRRLDASFRPYLPSPVARRLGRGPSAGGLAGEERQVSVLFADLADFTTFSETRRPTEVLSMLNAYWAQVVPAIDASGGVIEHFAGDGVMVIFNAVGDQPDHAARAGSTGLAIAEVGRAVAGAHEGWPMFRVGINTGPAVVGDVGSRERRSFAVIGDTTNTAARLAAVGSPGQVVVAAATWDGLGAGRDGESLGPTRVKGKRAAIDAWILRSLP